jgi:hypothetical protein
MVAVGIIDVISHLPIGTLTPLLDADGPFTAGNHALTTWHDGITIRNVSDSFGVIAQVNGAIAPKLGRAIGFDDGGTVNLDLFEERIVQIAALHQLLGGAWIGTSVDEVFYLPYLIRWAEALPGKLGLYVAPTWAIDLYFLRAL